jgi:DNA-directed RNA polymerase subunit RPC12/RpoP
LEEIKMADEYIRLDTAIIAIDNLINEAATGSIARALFNAKDVIYSQQRYSADVQPVKRGYWEEVTDYGGWGDTHYRCSVCGEEWYLEDGKPKDNDMNFCPRCGARMDGEQNENN